MCRISVNTLLVTLRQVIESFLRYILSLTSQALDGSPLVYMKDTALNVLAQIYTWSIKHLHVPVTSRDEAGIQIDLTAESKAACYI